MNIVHPTQSGRILFSHDELKDPVSCEVTFANTFVGHLISLRLKYDKPMIVTGPVRTKARNEAMRAAHPRSLHVYDLPNHGLAGAAALDFAIPADSRAAFVQLALSLGWSIGVASTFVHIDRRDLAGLPQGLFGYGLR